MIRSSLQSTASVKLRVYLASVYFLPITVFVFMSSFFLQQPPLGLFKQALELMKCMKRRKRGWDWEEKLPVEGWFFLKSTRLYTLEGPVGVGSPPFHSCISQSHVSVLILTWNSFCIIRCLCAFKTMGIMVKLEFWYMELMAWGGLKCAVAVSKAVALIAVIRWQRRC